MKKEWLSLLAKYPDNVIAKLLARCLPRVPYPSWFEWAVIAVTDNARTNGKVWQKYLRHGAIDYDDVVAAINAYKRHHLTNYDALLQMGMSRDDARKAVA
jgi:hypothetical protein